MRRTRHCARCSLGGLARSPPAATTTTTADTASRRPPTTSAARDDALPSEPSAAGGAAATAPRATRSTDGTLTIATGDPAFPPWVHRRRTRDRARASRPPSPRRRPRDGLRRRPAVTWVRTTFDEAIQPGAKNFDFNLQQFSITPERAETVDFCDPYYTSNQAIVGLEGSPAEGATTVADLKDVKFGAQAGTTSLDFITDVIQPDARAVRLRRQRRRQGGARGQPDRRHRRRPADGVLHHRRRDRGQQRRRPVPRRGRRHRPTTSGLRVREGQPARRVRQRRARGADATPASSHAITDEWLRDTTASPRSSSVG